MPRSSSRTAARPPRQGRLFVDTPADRLQSLRLEQGELLTRIKHKGAELERALGDIRRVGSEVEGRLVPIHQAIEAQVNRLHDLFDQLLARGRLVGRARKEVARLYRELVEDGVLPPRLILAD